MRNGYRQKRVEQPRETWIVVENQHEALVSKELFDKANANIVGLDMSGRTVGKKKSFLYLWVLWKNPETQEQDKRQILLQNWHTTVRE